MCDILVFKNCFHKFNVCRYATGSIAGLATVTPCAGFIGPLGALMLGVAAGVICRFFSLVVKEKYGYDDSLDVFGVHGVGGFVGTCLLGIVAAPAFGGFNTDTTMMTQTIIQCTAAFATAAYTAVASYACLMAAKVGLYRLNAVDHIA
jgi:Amt family ammonium transporter